MKAFWWFKENQIAGMARPGFNRVRWFDLPFEETLVFGWLGQRSCATEPIDSLKRHFQNYGSRIRSFHKVDEEEFRSICEAFEREGKLLEVMQKVTDRTGCVESFAIEGDQLNFRLNRSALNSEIQFLKQNQIGTVVSLTEDHHQSDALSEHFQLHHLPINDLEAPRTEQAQALAQILKVAKTQNQGVAVHCMAGIGRTSTMLIAAHLLMGESLESLLSQIARANPVFKLTGPQADFVRAVAAQGSV